MVCVVLIFVYQFFYRLVIFGKTMKNLMLIFLNDQDNFLISNWNNFLWILVIFAIMATLIFKESLDALKSVSVIAVVAIFTFFVSLVVIFIYKIAIGDPSVHFSEAMLWPRNSFLTITGTLPTVFLAFTFQFNLFPIYFTIKEKTNAKLMKATGLGVNFCLLVYLTTGFLGIFMYSDNLNEPILKALFDDGVKARLNNDIFLLIMLVLINLSFLTSAVMSIPLMFFSLKKNFINTLIFCRRKFFKPKTADYTVHETQAADEVPANANATEPPSKLAFSDATEKIIITVLYCSICVVSILVPNLQTVFSLVGALAANSISFILPNLFYLKLARMEHKGWQVVPLILCICGVVFSALCFTGEIIKTFK
jgi:amino acid permease